MTPAFSPGPCSTHGAFVGSVLSTGRECLYEQCSLQSALTIPSSVNVGSRPSMATSRWYSSGVSPCSATRAGVIAGSPGRGRTVAMRYSAGGLGAVVSAFGFGIVSFFVLSIGGIAAGGGAGSGLGAGITSAFPLAGGGAGGLGAAVPPFAIAAPVLRASAALICVGELLSPVYFRFGSRKIASTTLSCTSTTTSFMPQVFSQPFR